MTTADALVFYPQYCFHLSPTINAWCPLRAIDIAGLGSRPGFEDTNVFFYLNHPIRWVRIIGVVVAIDHYYSYQVYTIDDSTGQCIECTFPAPSPRNDRTNHQDINKAHAAETGTTGAAPTAPLPVDIDIGTILYVKGSVKVFRGQKQIKIESATRVLSTTEEVLFWDKARDFRRITLSQPWVLKDREVRKCWRLQQVEASELEEEKKAKKKAKVYANGRNEDRGDSLGKAAKARRAAGRESSRSRIFKNQYDALGL